MADYFTNVSLIVPVEDPAAQIHFITDYMLFGDEMKPGVGLDRHDRAARTQRPLF